MLYIGVVIVIGGCDGKIVFDDGCLEVGLLVFKGLGGDDGLGINFE